MDFDLDAFRDLLSSNEETVYEVSYDGGGPGSSGSARVTKCLDAYWSYDDNGEFGGPYDTLGDALFEQHLCFGGVSIDVQCDELTASEIASQLQICLLAWPTMGQFLLTSMVIPFGLTIMNPTLVGRMNPWRQRWLSCNWNTPHP